MSEWTPRAADERAVRAAADDVQTFWKPLIRPELTELMIAYFNSRRLNTDLARANGWYPGYGGDQAPRVIIPAVGPDDSVIFWQARALLKGRKRWQSPQRPRHDALVVVRPFSWRQPIGTVVVEGPMDALVAAMYGWVGIALLGATPSELVLEHLRTRVLRFAASQARLISDADAPYSMAKVFGYLTSAGVPCTLRVSYPCKDLAACTEEQRAALLA